MKHPLSVKLLAVFFVASLPAAHGFDLEGDREDFLAAEAALERGDPIELELLAGFLEDYPLYPYLRYAQLVLRLDSADPESIDRFLAELGDTPLAGRLRRAWLKHLAKAGRWEEYVRFYVPDDSTVRRCHYLRGLLATGEREPALDRVAPLWLTGRSLPRACDPVLDAWRKAGRLTERLVWERIALAMEAGETRLAGFLGRSLSAGERVWAERWLRIQRNPRLVLDRDGFTEAHPYRAHILADGVARLARKEPSLAADTWDRLSEALVLPADQAERANAAVGFALVKIGDARGLSYLDRVPARVDNLNLQERRLRTALKREDWRLVADWTSAMPEGGRKAEHWRYWQARAEEELGRTDRAWDLFEAAAQERGLWGFLAAERVGMPYHLDGKPTPADPQRLACMEQSATSARLRELEALGREGDLGREWNRLTRDMDRADLMVAAVLAQRRGWPVRAIFTLARSSYWDDLELRFPLLHKDIVRDQAAASGLDASWIYAVLRQESTFNPTAVSPAGALGLMQLMPATAREVARTLDLPRPTRSRLFDPEFNITLGSGYLAEMHQRFGGNPVLATAAYNAGPARVERWLPEQAMDADLWIALIPFSETRTYVRRVLAYRLIYEYRLGVPLEPLSDIMQPISRRWSVSSGSDYPERRNRKRQINQ